MRYCLVLCALLVALCLGAWASPTGLNNIPTADVAPFHTLVLQQYSTFGSGETAAFWAGAKMGVLPRLEVGIDDHLAGGETGSPVLQAKYRFLSNDKRLSAAVGVANVGDSRRNGDTAFYLALKRNLVPQVRAHAGYMIQGRDDSFLLGLDGDITKKWVWRTDAVQDGSDWLLSAGAIGPLGKHALLEAWTSVPTDGGDESFTLKFDWVIGK